MVDRTSCSGFLVTFLLLMVFSHGYRMPSLRRTPSCTRQHAWLPDFDITGLSNSIGNLDQFFQGALNSASTGDSMVAPVAAPEVQNIFLEGDDGFLFLYLKYIDLFTHLFTIFREI